MRRVPLIKPVSMQDIFEHTPLDYYKYGQYPRDIVPVPPRVGDFPEAVEACARERTAEDE